ncbi:hypothetical protein GGTG_00602 [Gaeumannomyces tritici R3-111a-1]|uniref:Uncharacterized protein n=1 Tax=Gaeumannomyces tritici (strain R3-111a-1) TaxID=644352 RepID=J3NH64_GAET3|nr:hypothetical protein GGTG_00602 [Gaeumannomyces tritici R3-111a-1]EJT80607.1 hypothetical protein GGTG_00602 [Gaeumannomyces tritici R3-111a-1]
MEGSAGSMDQEEIAGEEMSLAQQAVAAYGTCHPRPRLHVEEKSGTVLRQPSRWVLSQANNPICVENPL